MITYLTELMDVLNTNPVFGGVLKDVNSSSIIPN